jgi:hypothetical protein
MKPGKASGVYQVPGMQAMPAGTGIRAMPWTRKLQSQSKAGGSEHHEMREAVRVGMIRA